MPESETLRESSRHNDRAWDSVLALADKPTETPLDQPFEMGRGFGRQTLLPLCTHGTHHRAQALNMLRHLEVPIPDLDLDTWLCQDREVRA